MLRRNGGRGERGLEPRNGGSERAISVLLQVAPGETHDIARPGIVKLKLICVAMSLLVQTAAQHPRLQMKGYMLFEEY